MNWLSKFLCWYFNHKWSYGCDGKPHIICSRCGILPKSQWREYKKLKEKNKPTIFVIYKEKLANELVK